MQEHEQTKSALRKFELALHAYKLAAGIIIKTDSFTTQSAQETAARYVFYRLQAERQVRTYHLVISEFHPDDAPFENDLTIMDRGEMNTALAEAKNGHYSRIREYIQEFETRWPQERQDSVLAKNTKTMLAAIADFGERFQEPQLPDQDSDVIESYEKTKRTLVPPNLD